MQGLTFVEVAPSDTDLWLTDTDGTPYVVEHLTHLRWPRPGPDAGGRGGAGGGRGRPGEGGVTVSLTAYPGALLDDDVFADQWWFVRIYTRGSTEPTHSSVTCCPRSSPRHGPRASAGGSTSATWTSAARTCGCGCSVGVRCSTTSSGSTASSRPTSASC